MTASRSPHLPNNRLIWLCVFSISMGLLEAIVVVYLRELYFPGGFRFPLRFISEQMLRMEMLREFCTIAMLVSLSLIAGHTARLRFAVFLFTFGIWDLFYYVFLKVILGWPQSLLTWDVLFLIPLTWLGPVLAPVICAFTMICLAVLMIVLQRRSGGIRISPRAWLMLTAGALAIFFTFIRDSVQIIIDGGFLTDLASLSSNKDFQAAVASYVPTHFNWFLFSMGESLIVLSGVAMYGDNAEM